MPQSADVLNDQVIRTIRELLQAEHLQDRTVNTYTHWIERFLWLNQGKPIERLDEQDVNGFMHHVRQQLSASQARQKQALRALQYFFSIIRPRLSAQLDEENSLSA
ncbi:site-specific integrase [Hahella sp. SMD15-11]|uniref:Site-specific integrase n=1 Tax=Thermohahella caldifontis TaxID=3142973 RepID=A0AB39UU23_9GAMM